MWSAWKLILDVKHEFKFCMHLGAFFPFVPTSYHEITRSIVFLLPLPNFTSGPQNHQKASTNHQNMLVRCLKHKIRSHGHLNHQFFPLHPFPKIGHIPKDCLKEHLQGLGLVAEEDFRHFLNSFLHVCKLERCHLPLHISKRILHSTEFRCV